MSNLRKEINLSILLVLVTFLFGLKVSALQKGEEAQVRAFREKEIQQLELMLKRGVSIQQKAELYLRIAELYFEFYKSEFVAEGREHEKQSKKNSKLTEPYRAKRAQYYLKESIRAAEKILKLDIREEHKDKVYFLLAFSYQELGDQKRAKKNYLDLVQKYPSSSFVVEAYRELGGISFSEKRYSEAEQYFLEAIQKSKTVKTDEELLPVIYHKLAWTYYRMRRFSQATDMLKKVIELSIRDSEKFLPIQEEALRDLAVFMLDSGKVNEAIQYFHKVAGDRPYYPTALLILAKSLEKGSRLGKAEEVYHFLIQTYGNREATIEAVASLSEIYILHKEYEKAANLLKDMKFPKGDLSSYLQKLKKTVRKTATNHHESAQKSANQEKLEVAESFYTVYLYRFLQHSDPKNEKAEIQMYLADVKSRLGKSEEAASLYKQVLQSQNKNFANQAGALWVSSLAKSIENRVQGEPSKKSSRKNPSQLEEDFVKAVDEYRDQISDTNASREAYLRSAQVLAGYSATRNQGRQRAEKLVVENANSKQAIVAAQLLLQVAHEDVEQTSTKEHSERLARIANLKSVISKIESNSKLMRFDRSKNRGNLKRLLESEDDYLTSQLIMTYEKSGQNLKAAALYLSLAEASRDEKDADWGYLKSLQSYEKARDWASLLNVFGTWLKKAKRKTTVSVQLRNYATKLFLLGEFVYSADLFRLAGLHDQDPVSLETAARVYRGLNQVKKSNEVYQSYIKRYRKHRSIWRVRLEYGMYLELNGDESGARKQFQVCKKSLEFEAECGSRLGDLELRGKDLKAAEREFRWVSKRAVSASKRRKVISPFYSYSHYRRAEITELHEKFSPLTLPESKLQKTLAHRLKFFNGLNQAYMRAVDYGGPWGVASLHRLAKWTFNFSREIDAIEPPPVISDEKLFRFRASLEAVSRPLLEQAQGVWSRAYQISNRGVIPSPVLPEIVDFLARFENSQIKRAQGFRGKLLLSGMPANGGELGYAGALNATRSQLLEKMNQSPLWVDYGNLLWGDRKPLLAQIAYEHALELDEKNSAAYNNRGVVTLSGFGQENWYSVYEGKALLEKAIQIDPNYLPSQYNFAALLNYYRLFQAALPLWESLQSRLSIADVLDGLAVARYGSGKVKESKKAFELSEKMGARDNRFVKLFHLASAEAESKKGASKCISYLSDIDRNSVFGFEKDSTQRLEKRCQLWLDGEN